MTDPDGQPTTRISRRALVRAGAALGAAPLLAACGQNTTGAKAGSNTLSLLSTQHTPTKEADAFRQILKAADPSLTVNFNPGDTATTISQVKAQVQARSVRVNAFLGIHSDLSTLGPDNLADVSGLVSEIGSAGISAGNVTLSKIGTDKNYYVPLEQATYLLAVNKKALGWLPAGADVNSLTYDQLLAWAKAGKAANGGKAVFGLPAGPKGLLHRFTQGYLYPSFTGGLVTTFRSPDAVTAWQYFKELWSVTLPASTNVDFMQEPLASGQVLIGWDHVARLVDAPRDKPDDWLMVPAPQGPKARGYLAILNGIGIVKGSPDQDRTRQLIKALVKPEVQLDILRKLAFFPTVRAAVPADLPPAIKLESQAVTRTQTGGLLSLPSVGMGASDSKFTKVFQNCFTAIVLGNAGIQQTLDAQAKTMQQLITDANARCWVPDPQSSGPCQVG
ncbi:MAG: multiple sugar transport system substrate-binding protein [Micromonosporaceae bacterium]